MIVELCDLCGRRLDAYGGRRFRYKIQKFLDGKWINCDICYYCIDKLKKEMKERKNE